MGSRPEAQARADGAAQIIRRLALGLCAVADLSVLAVLVAEDATSGTPGVIAALAPEGRQGLLIFALTASIVLGLVIAVRTLPGPYYGISLFQRTNLRGLARAAPAYPLLALAFGLYWFGGVGLSYFGWFLRLPGSAMAAVSAGSAFVGAAALALWMIAVALGMRPASARTSDVAPYAPDTGTADRADGRGSEFIGGGVVPVPFLAGGGVKIRVPGLRLVVMPERLEFHERGWAGTVLRQGAFTMPRREVRVVYPKRRSLLPLQTWDVVIETTDPNLRWTFWSPVDSGPLLLTMEECGYPVDWSPRNKKGVPVD